MLEFRTNTPTVAVPADHVTLMDVFKLTPLEAKLLQAMLVGNWISSKDVPDAASSMRQLIFNLRGKIERKYNVAIINDGRGKYAISTAAKETLAKELEKVTLGS